MSDLIDRQKVIDILDEAWVDGREYDGWLHKEVRDLPSAQPEYEPVKAEDFAKTMSENTLYGFMVWHGEAFTLIKEMGFVICKKTM